MLDGFIDSDTLIIKAQVQVIRCFMVMVTRVLILMSNDRVSDYFPHWYFVALL